MSTNRAIAYLRVANARQINNNNSFEKQALKISEYAERNNIQIVKWFRETGRNRSVLGSAVKYCTTKNNINFLLVPEPTRLSRSLDEYYSWKLAFKAKGVQFNFTDVSFREIDSASLKLREAISLVMAGHYSNALSTQIKRGIEHKRSQEKLA